jgi:iron complex outermembrane recepter protein
MIRRQPMLAAAVAAALAATMQAPSVSAQLLEEVIVTAQKREQNLQEVGISISAFSGNQLEALGMKSSVDISQQVPAMQLQTFTPAFTIINLRGISQNSFQDNLEAPVAVYVDGAYIASMNAINGQLFDTERVEVLRGPQGTLFGRNTTGGLVHYLTRGATDRELNGYIEGQVGEFNLRAFEGAIGGALTENSRGRIAARWQENDGYVKSLTPGIRDAHGADGYTIRGSFQADFTENFLFDLRVTRAKDSDVPSGTYSINFADFDPDTGLGVPAPGRFTKPLEHASTTEGYFSRTMTNVNLTMTWDLADNLELVSITHYLDHKKEYLEDAGGGLFFFPYQNNSDFRSRSQEFRLSGEGEQLRWQTGFYYLDMTTDTDQNVAGAAILEESGAISDSAQQFTDSSLDSRNLSLFAQAEYDLAPNLTLIGGLRWSADSKRLDFTQFYQEPDAGIPLTQVFDISRVGIAELDSINYTDWAARLQLNYTLDDGTLLYAAWNRGIKGGNWSIDPLGTVAAIEPANLRHNEEVLYSYEIGVKTDVSEKVRLNASLYYYDYEDYQAFSILGLTPQVANSDARSYGGEVEMTLFLVDNLDLLFGAAYIDSKVDAVPDVFGGTVKAEFPNAPAWSFNGLVRYNWDVPGGRVSAQLDGMWNDQQFIEASNSAISREGSYFLWNARVAFDSADDRWTLAAWVKNAGDARYRLYNLDLGLLGISEEVFAPPRWFGATATYRF